MSNPLISLCRLSRVMNERNYRIYKNDSTAKSRFVRIFDDIVISSLLLHIFISAKTGAPFFSRINVLADYLPGHRHDRIDVGEETSTDGMTC